MAGIDGVTPSGSRPLLRLSYADEAGTPPVPSAAREQQLAHALDQRLSTQLNRIRNRLAAPEAAPQAAPNPPGTGTRLDILA